MPPPRIKTEVITLLLQWLSMHRCIQQERALATMLYNLDLYPTGTYSSVCRVTKVLVAFLSVSE